MKRKAASLIAATALLAALGILAGCGGGGGDGGGSQTTTTLQHPLFPSTVGDTWTFDWYDDTMTYVGTTTETVTAVSGNRLTVTDDSGDARTYEIREDGIGRLYVVMTGGTDTTFSPAVTIIPPDLTDFLAYVSGGYSMTISGLGTFQCTGYTLTPSTVSMGVPAGTFNPAQQIYTSETWVPGVGGEVDVDSIQIYAEGVGPVWRYLPLFDFDTGAVEPGWTIMLTDYSVS